MRVCRNVVPVYSPIPTRGVDCECFGRSRERVTSSERRDAADPRGQPPPQTHDFVCGAARLLSLPPRLQPPCTIKSENGAAEPARAAAAALRLHRRRDSVLRPRRAVPGDGGGRRGGRGPPVLGAGGYPVGQRQAAGRPRRDGGRGRAPHGLPPRRLLLRRRLGRPRRLLRCPVPQARSNPLRY